MRRRALLALVAVLALTGGCVDVVVTTSDDGDVRNATVTHVVDGDTVDVQFADGSTDRVRLLGVDTPEVHVETQPDNFEGVPDTEAGHACLRRAGHNASTFTTDLVGGERVRVETDPTADRRGGYDRLLAYVHHDGRSLNYALVETGHAGVYPSTFQERDRYEAAAMAARDANRGLWRCRSAG